MSICLNFDHIKICNIKPSFCTLHYLKRGFAIRLELDGVPDFLYTFLEGGLEPHYGGNFHLWGFILRDFYEVHDNPL